MPRKSGRSSYRDQRLRAARLGPRELRWLDALHLATALSPGDEVRARSCHDDRLGDAASATGLEAAAPR